MDMNTSQKYRRMIITWFTEDIDLGIKKLKEHPNLVYSVLGKEVCPSTGRLHIQGYMRFSKQVYLPTFIKLFKGIHVEAARGSELECVSYCKKDDDYVETGEAARPGKRTDLVLLKDAVKSGLSYKEIVEKYDDLNWQQLKVLDIYTSLFSVQKKRKVPKVTWICGPSGVGKTREVEDLEDAHYQDDCHWWDGYNGQKTVVFDDFRGSQVKFRKLLRILDRLPLKVPVKGRMVNLEAEEYVFTSTRWPHECYSKEDEDMKQLYRRITKLVYMPTRNTKTELGSGSEVWGNTKGPDLYNLNFNLDASKLHKKLEQGYKGFD
ncbi:replication associated protein [Dipodfec virus RodF1_132]|uniref:Replication-associated protein n=1 Tax=Dipodfec virus RodF1_132 TaxID=2929273 RepID=A0A976N3B1_9VIRU|nr:replication associated protein [Dipodfec virus RodF1_132]